MSKTSSMALLLLLLGAIPLNDRVEVLSKSDGLGHTHRATYNARGDVTSETDAMNYTTHYQRDGEGRVVLEENAVGNKVAYTYDNNGNRLTETRTRRTAGVEVLVTRHEYDKNGRLKKTTYPDGTSTRTEYGLTGQRVATVDEAERRTTYAYETSDRLRLTTYPDGTTEELDYDGEGRRTREKDRAGRVTRHEYNNVGRRTRTRFADGASVATSYDALGRPVAQTDEMGYTTVSEYDDAGRRTQVRDALGHATVYTYDADGNVTSVTDPLGRTTRHEHDALGRPVRTIFPNGTEERVVYDSLDREVTKVDASGRMTTFTHDALGRLVQVTDAARHTTRFGYDELDNLISQTDAISRTTTFAHDTRGRRTRRTLPTGEFETWEYDATGNVVKHTSVSGQTCTQTFDTADRLVRREDSDGTTVAFTYTASGQRESYTDARGTTRYTYDARDRLTGTTAPDGRRLTYAYDGRGLRTALSAHMDGREYVTRYAHDARGLMVKVTDPLGREYTQAYDGAGQRTERVLPNGIRTRYGHDVQGRLTSLVSTQGATVLQQHAYMLGPTGQRLRSDEAGGTSLTYEYDALDRLLRVTAAGAPGSEPLEDTFTYDAVGNRLSHRRSTRESTRSTTYAYDARDRLLSGGTTEYTWQADGQLASKVGAQGAQYTWDMEDRLRQVKLPDGTLVEHQYDPEGVRVRTRHAPPNGPPSTTEYLVDTAGPLSHVMAETDNTGALKAHYIRAGDELLAVVRPGGTRFYLADGSGSVRHLINEAGALTDSYRYDAFGFLLAHEGADPNPYLFAGEPVEPASGLAYLRARWLDTVTGRFLSSDPVAGVNKEPLTLHRYAYALGDPVNKVDPTGEFTFSIAGLSVSINVQGNLRTTQGTIAAGTLQQFHNQLTRVNIASYGNLMRLWQGRLYSQGLQIHHLIEKRLWDQNPVLQQIFKSSDDIPSVVLKRLDHQMFTNLWRTALPYARARGYVLTPPLEKIVQEASRIYVTEPQMLKAIFLSLL